MLYRAAAILVVIFWLTMTGLLLRNEVRPGDSALREVPVGHVVKLLFHHQQTSDLNIVNDRLRLGRLRILPQSDKTTGLRVIAFDGDLHLTVPGAKRQRVAWKGELEMDKALVTQRFQLGVTTHDPMEIRSEIVVLPKENVARYQVSAGGTVERQEFSLDERGARQVFQQLGIDPEMLPAAQMPHPKPPTVRAQQSSMEIHGERMDTYLVTVESNGQTWLECHVDQLGKIVKATTLLGYTLTPDDITP
jgi:hypothetical protein